MQETSIPDQRRAVADHAAKNDFAVVREYVDGGILRPAVEPDYERTIREESEREGGC
jgi:hypothetical protein